MGAISQVLPKAKQISSTSLGEKKEICMKVLRKIRKIAQICKFFSKKFTKIS